MLCYIIIATILLTGCSTEFFQEEVEGEWTGSGLFGPLSKEYATLTLTFTSDSVFYYGTSIYDSSVSYGKGSYEMDRRNGTMVTIVTDSLYEHEDPYSGWITTSGFEIRRGTITNEWGLELEKVN